MAAGWRGRLRWPQTKRLILSIVAAALLAGGASALGVAVVSQRHAPQPSAAAAGTTGVGHETTGAAPLRNQATLPSVTAPSASVLDDSMPTAISIPNIGVRSPVFGVGLNPDGSLQVPQPGPDYNKAAWYQGSVSPGQVGTSVIEGHVDSASEGPSVFFRLGNLHPGDRVSVTRADDTTATFVITGVREYPKDQFPADQVYANTDYPALRLITCGGAFDHASGHYLSNIVAYGELASPAGPPGRV